MKFEMFSSNLDKLVELGVVVPDYYFLFRDEDVLTVDKLAEVFETTQSTVRRWFNPGLRHGPLKSRNPTQYSCTGRDFKEWCFNRDIGKLSKSSQFQTAATYLKANNSSFSEIP
ncbi:MULTISPECIES: hypothetical protein [Brevibacillus]|uniref:hypothetical protein n=1 Tax=Brevibacillus TaxID=55080 RepID=UPI000EC1231C|nr:hypothetical protein [Brevibacillus sp.]HBZ80253.1 hypothetical protein [Brevibacillus sp.]